MKKIYACRIKGCNKKLYVWQVGQHFLKHHIDLWKFAIKKIIK